MNCSVQLREDHQERIMESHRRRIRRDSPTCNSIFMSKEPGLRSTDSQLTTPLIRGGGHWARITLMIKRSMIQLVSCYLLFIN